MAKPSIQRALSLLWLLSVPTSAFPGGALVDWRQWGSGDRPQVVTDNVGTKIEAAPSVGPGPNDGALKVSATLVEWGAVWSPLKADLARTKSLRFQAKVSAPALLEVALIDERMVRYVAKVRVVSDEWESFNVPLASFEPTKYPDPSAPPGATLAWSRITRIQFSPWTSGTTTYWIGPVYGASAKSAARTGMPDATARKGWWTVQDFVLLDKRSYGPFTGGGDSTEIRLDVERDPENRGARVGRIRYSLDPKGWCGLWLRCGDDWGGQDWRGAKALKLEYDCDEPLLLEVGFNDRNQNAYVAVAPLKPNKGVWASVEILLKDFKLNPDYKPREGRPGALRDLSHIETFNISPKTPGRHELKLRAVNVKK